MDPNKKVLKNVIAMVSLQCGVPQVGDMDCARFEIQSSDGVCQGEAIYVYDHRPVSVAAARLYLAEQSYDHKAAMIAAVNTPAKVVIMEKGGPRPRQYVNLYPASAVSTALFSETAYIGKHNASYCITEINPIWRFESHSKSRTGQHWGSTIVALTDNDHKLVVEMSGYANTGDKYVDIRQEIGASIVKVEL